MTFKVLGHVVLWSLEVDKEISHRVVAGWKKCCCWSVISETYTSAV